MLTSYLTMIQIYYLFYLLKQCTRAPVPGIAFNTAVFHPVKPKYRNHSNQNANLDGYTPVQRLYVMCCDPP